MTTGDRYLIVSMTTLIIAVVYSVGGNDLFCIIWLLLSLYLTYKQIKADKENTPNE